ncbi:MAG: radical SAM protein [Candidatus Methylomirabilales bacterium]
MTASVATLSKRELRERFAARCAGRRFPLHGQWELTCRCNLKCVMCYTNPFNTPEQIKQELTYDEIIRILDEIHDAGCLELCFTGGEPFTRRDFLAIYTYAKHKGFILTIFTNGTLITPVIADHLEAYPPKMIEISFHGLTKASFEHITQGHGSFDRCREGIRLILERGLPLTLKTTGMTINRNEILKIKEYVGRLGNARYRFGSDIHPRLDGSEDVSRYQLPEDEVRAIEQPDTEFATERLRQDRVKQQMVRQGRELCGGGKYKFHIDAYGRLQLCSNNRTRGYDLRKGSFLTGFYEQLPSFPCRNRSHHLAQDQPLVSSISPHMPLPPSPRPSPWKGEGESARTSRR